MSGMEVLWIYFVIINIISFTIMGIDKRKARKHEYRISEATLWLLAWVGGGTGGFAGMRNFRHKTKHASFAYGFPILMVLQLLAMVYLTFQ
ncbi:DUF1294 domain-containing protein [Bacillus sp. MUM 13]|uniref:DUF1294 domain-containing protein n=1 Tax=Bacillus sp. MUM 13 TaxID=1678001 RepID=UPI001F0AD48F|nr:DUF1294 domain-containing protein [Bacillus sp. MUM 13]